MPHRRLLRGMIASAGTTLLLAALGAITGIISTRALGPSERGLLAAATVWASVVSSIFGVGLPQAVTFHIGRAPERAGAIAASAMAICTVIGSAVAVVGVVLALLLAGRARVPMAILLAGTPAMIGAGFPPGAMLGTGRYRLWSALRPVGPLLLLVGVGATVAAGGRTATIIAVITLVSWVGHWLAGLLMLRRVGLLGRPDREASRDLLSYGLRNLLAGAAWLVTYKLDQLYLSVAVIPALLGLYAVAATVTEIIVPVASSAGAIMLARVAAGAAEDARVALRPAVAFCLSISIPAAAVAAVAAPQVLSLLFGDRFRPAAPVLRIYVLGGVALALATVLADTLRGLGRPLDPAKAELVGAVSTISLLVALVPSHGIRGAALASTISYTLVLALLAVMLRQRLAAGGDAGLHTAS